MVHVMSKNQHTFQFIGLIVLCLVLILTMEAPNRNLVPVLWGLIGFTQNGYRFWRTWMQLSDDLVENHSSKLRTERIPNRRTKIAKVVDIRSLLSKEKELTAYSSELGKQIGLIRLYLHLLGIAFVVFGLFSILVVFLSK